MHLSGFVLRFAAPLLLCAVPCSAWCQDAAAPQPSDAQVPTFHTQTTVVTVPTVVVDKHGHRIWALQADDFAITDNGVPQRVMLDDPPAPPPRAVVIVVQENQDTFLLEDSLNQALGDFLNALPDGDIPIAVLTAGTKAKIYMPFTNDRDAVEAKLHHLAPDADAGGPKILDGVYLAAKMLEQNYPDRDKYLLLVSGARDGDSAVKILSMLPGGGSRGEAKAKRDRWNSSHTGQEVLEYVEQENIVVDAIEFSRTGMAASDYWKDHDFSTIALNPISLLFHAGDWVRKDVPRNLAQATGGEVRNVSRKAAVSAGAIRIATDFSAAYDISFHPTDHTPGLHEIRVTTPDRDQLRTLHRAFYWAQSTPDAR